MKKFKVKVTVSKTMVVTEEDWRDEGGIGPFDESAAVNYCKGTLIEEITNDPNRGSVKFVKEMQ